MDSTNMLGFAACALVAACGGAPPTATPRPVPLQPNAQCPTNTVDVSTWFLAGRTPQKYAMSSDSSVTCNSSVSLSLKSTTAASQSDFGTVMSDDKATRAVPLAFLGKRVRLSGFVRADQVTGWAGLWMRVDGPGGYSTNGRPAQVLAFDNMQNRPITGTTDWAQYQVVLDVAASAVNLAYGILLSAEGSTWLSGVNVEVVDATVPTTGR
jgi:hypothetical protein